MAEASNKSKDEVASRDVEEVASETEEVFRGFMLQRLTSEIDRESTEGNLDVASIPTNSIHVLTNNLQGAREQIGREPRDPRKKEQEQLGQALASFGDEINTRYHGVFSEMLCRLNIGNEDLAYSAFQSIAKRLFENGINWGRIIALLCFGYEVAFDVIKKNVAGLGKFLRKIIKFVVDFIVKNHIASWIVRHGGWVGALSGMSEDDVALWTRRGIAVAVILSAVYVGYKYLL